MIRWYARCIKNICIFLWMVCVSSDLVVIWKISRIFMNDLCLDDPLMICVRMTCLLCEKYPVLFMNYLWSDDLLVVWKYLGFLTNGLCLSDLLVVWDWVTCSLCKKYLRCFMNDLWFGDLLVVWKIQKYTQSLIRLRFKTNPLR
jgi:hypothetical protein